jgi:hypothetical protein
MTTLFEIQSAMIGHEITVDIGSSVRKGIITSIREVVLGLTTKRFVLTIGGGNGLESCGMTEFSSGINFYSAVVDGVNRDIGTPSVGVDRVAEIQIPAREVQLKSSAPVRERRFLSVVYQAIVMAIESRRCKCRQN